jgi:hypothetical protein
MKKLFPLLVLVALLNGCKDVLDIGNESNKIEDIFTLTQSNVIDGKEIVFNVPADGIYILTLIDTRNDNVVTREKFKGTSGLNKKSIYTKSLTSKSFYLLLEDGNRFQIGKTLIILQN